MDIIIKLAEKFIRYKIKGGHIDYKKIIEDAKEQLYDIDDALDKVKFLSIILEGNNQEYNLHISKCTKLDTCEKNFAHESINYFLNQELNRLGINISEDTFTVDEKNNSEDKLDQILKDLDRLKVGHEIIYEDLRKELNELKELYFLGKKKWYQLFVGKFVEMAGSGVVSETISKEIIAGMRPLIQNVLSA